VQVHFGVIEDLRIEPRTYRHEQRLQGCDALFEFAHGYNIWTDGAADRLVGPPINGSRDSSTSRMSAPANTRTVRVGSPMARNLSKAASHGDTFFGPNALDIASPLHMQPRGQEDPYRFPPADPIQAAARHPQAGGADRGDPPRAPWWENQWGKAARQI
jgi:hypothetical protein